jgi:hypothetical protein
MRLVWLFAQWIAFTVPMKVWFYMTKISVSAAVTAHLHAHLVRLSS